MHDVSAGFHGTARRPWVPGDVGTHADEQGAATVRPSKHSCGYRSHSRNRLKMNVVNTIAVRPAHDDELTALAELRWRWVLENGGRPAITREEFVRRFVKWARENSSSHHRTVLLRGDVVIGMAWLAVLKRVPTPRFLERASGDVQCVYVVPEERDTGLGGRLIDAVLDLARELGLERVTVHSSVRAISAYSRHGFTMSRRLLQTEFAQSPK
jgi:GNAT superfamily N-acetyltransferase